MTDVAQGQMLTEITVSYSPYQFHYGGGIGFKADRHTFGAKFTAGNFGTRKFTGAHVQDDGSGNYTVLSPITSPYWNSLGMAPPSYYTAEYKSSNKGFGVSIDYAFEKPVRRNDAHIIAFGLNLGWYMVSDAHSVKFILLSNQNDIVDRSFSVEHTSFSIGMNAAYKQMVFKRSYFKIIGVLPFFFPDRTETYDPIGGVNLMTGLEPYLSFCYGIKFK